MIYETPEQRLARVTSEANTWRLRAEEREALGEVMQEETPEEVDNGRMDFGTALEIFLGGLLIFVCLCFASYVFLMNPFMLLTILSLAIISFVGAKAIQYFWNRNLD